MAKVLITGGAGFIGSHIAKECIIRGDEVTIIDDLSGGFMDQVPKGVRFIKGSITQKNLLEALFDKGNFEYVYHFAAYAAEGLSHFIREFNYTNNLIGSVNLINLSVVHNIRCFVFTSSIAIYGNAKLPFKEDCYPRPEDPYGIAKYAVELDLKAANEHFGLNYVIFRPHNVFGEHQNIADKYRNVIGIFMNQIMSNKKLTIFGDGTQTRAFSYIADVAPYIAASVYNPRANNEIINIGADIAYKINDLAKMVIEEFGINPGIQYLPARKEVKNAFSDHSKAKRIFGEITNVPLRAGIKNMADWALKVGFRKSTDFEAIEIKTNLPQCWLK